MSDASPRAIPVTLARETALPPAQDFAALKEQALTWLPDWCYGTWTDFNDHDPGIMILEQVLYGLTELPYRAELSIHQLLADDHDRIPWHSNSLYAPTQILPMQPLTPADYARLLYGQIPDLVYASVELYTESVGEPTPGVGGRLQADFAVDPDAEASTAAQVGRNVHRVLDGHCNLGERFDRIAPRRPVFFDLQLDLLLTPGADANEVAANLYLAIKQALLPGPRFHTLAQALAHETMDAALKGPLLDRGILEDDDLPQLLTWPQARERTAQSLAGAGGVRAVQAIVFPNERERAALPSRELFALGRKITVQPAPEAGSGSNVHSPSHIRIIFEPQAPGPAPADQVSSSALSDTELSPTNKLITVAGENPSVQFARLLPETSWTMPAVQEGSAAEIGEYSSIQDHFPRCFAVQKDGLPSDASAQRRGEVRQLKGYLLVFEQMLANFFAQLANTASYFSNEAQTRTIFTQPLTRVPDVLPLLEGHGPDDLSTDAALRAASQEAYWDDLANPYRRGLQAVAEDQTQFLNRRARVLDHMLARFNESFPAPDHATFETITNQQNLLQAYPRLGFRRAMAATMIAPAPAHEPRPRSGLEEKLQLLLRRDTQGDPPPLTAETGASELAAVSDFYFVLEPIRFLPKPEPSAAAGASGSWSVPLSAFRPSLYHVFINWTYRPLTAAFVEYSENLVRENAPAHLWHHFIWLETRGDRKAPEAVRTFLQYMQAWAAAGYPTLTPAPEPDAVSEKPSAAPNTSSPIAPAPWNIEVCAGTAAADLFQWLRDRVFPPASENPATS